MKSLMLELVDVLQRLEAAVSNCSEARPPALPAVESSAAAAPPTSEQSPPEHRIELYDARRASHRQPLRAAGDAEQPPPRTAGAARNDVEQYRARELRRTASEVVKKLVVNPDEKEEKLQGTLTTDLEAEAEALRDIICVFGERKGVALIDEVDWILHPLKSELNFPIGDEVKAELSPERWALPIFILEAIFFERRTELSLPDGAKLMKESNGSRGWLDKLSRSLQKGVHELSLLEAEVTTCSAPV